MSVKFNVESAFNFGTNSYVIVFNTQNPSSTNTVTPVASAVQTGFAGYDLAIAVGETSGSITALAYSYYRPTGATYPVLYPIGATATQLPPVQLNSNGQGNQFQVIFDTTIALFNVTPSPSPTASAVGASPTPVPSGTVTQWWTYNFFTISGTMSGGEGAQTPTVVDSLGQGGPTDTNYTSTVLDLNQVNNVTFYTSAGNPVNTSDAITGGVITNNPLGTPSPSPTTSATATATAT